MAKKQDQESDQDDGRPLDLPHGRSFDPPHGRALDPPHVSHPIAPPGPEPDADGFTLLPDGTLRGPVGGRARLARGDYEHVAEDADGAWIYRRM